MTDIVIDGQSQPDVALSMQSGLTVSGRVAFDGRTAVPNSSRIRVTLLPSALRGPGNPGHHSRSRGCHRPLCDHRGHRGQVPAAGHHRRIVGLDAQLVDGERARRVLDFPLDVRQSLDGAVVTFSDRPAELSGIVRNGSGKPISAETSGLVCSGSHVLDGKVAPHPRRAVSGGWGISVSSGARR